MSHRLAPLWLVLAMVIVGSTVVAGKIIANEMPVSWHRHCVFC